MHKQPTASFLNTTAPFATLKRRDRARLSTIGTQLTRPSGSVLATRGSIARQVVVMLDGVATVFGQQQTRLEAGEQFGAVEFLTRTEHAETILADTSVHVWVLTIREFTTMLRDVPALARWYAAEAAALVAPEGIAVPAEAATPQAAFGVAARRQPALRPFAAAR